MADVQRRLERGIFFFFAMGSRGPVQVSIVGPSQEDSQPLILNPLAARIRWQAPIYRS